MNKLLITFILLPLTLNLAWGGPFEDVAEANERSDYATALKILRPLASRGDAKAQLDLGVMYDIGQGVTQNYNEANSWYRLAAEQGLAKAQIILGAMYEEGTGVTRDYTHAYMWYSLASVGGNAYSAKYRDNLAKEMTPQQIETAQEMTTACQTRNFKGC